MKKTVITLMMSLVATLVMAQENNTHVNDSVTWSKDLDGVTVTRMRRNVKADVDKISYDVKNDADAKASTVLDMLRKVPMVTVDGEDNITVNGSSSFKVYVDGKPNMMMSSAPSQVFKAMPASMVKSIEVVTNPGAKYDAEGGAGVLNIIMNKEMAATMGGTMDGYNGNVRAQAGNKSWGGSAFVSGQQGKLTYSANVMFNHSNPGATTTTMEQEQLGAMASKIVTESSSKPKTPFTMGNLSLSYDVDSMSTLGLTAGITSFRVKNHGYSTTNMGGGLYGNGYSYGTTTDMKMGRTSFNGSIDYQRFLNKDRTSSLALTYQLTYAPTNNEMDNKFDLTNAQTTWLNLTDRFSDNKERTTDHIFQADYTTPLSKSTTLNAGLKFSHRKATSDAKYYLADVYSEDLSSEYDYKNSILAGYAEFVGKFGKWSGKAGLRYEQTWQRVNYHLGNGDDFTTNYGNLVPSASLSYSFAPATNLGLTYNMRISRPGISYLNPYVDRSNPTALTYGNPDLDTEKTHSVGLVFNTFTSKLMLNVNLRHSFTDNAIEQYSFYDDANLLNTTYDNTGKNHVSSLNVYVQWMLHKNTRLFLNGGVDYSDMRSKALDLKNNGWHANAMVGLQQTLPADIKLGAYLITSTKRYTLQGWSTGFNILTANLSKTFLNDKLTLTLSAMTGLGNGGKLNIETYSRGKDFTNHMQIKVPMQGFTVSIAYNFGNTKKQFRQHQSRVENDYIEHQSQSESINNAQMGQQ